MNDVNTRNQIIAYVSELDNNFCPMRLSLPDGKYLEGAFGKTLVFYKGNLSANRLRKTELTFDQVLESGWEVNL